MPQAECSTFCKIHKLAKSRKLNGCCNMTWQALTLQHMHIRGEGSHCFRQVYVQCPLLHLAAKALRHRATLQISTCMPSSSLSSD